MQPTARAEKSITDDSKILSTHQKWLRINLDPERYGKFAEIGAGRR
jgi:hypothetical protein